MEEPLVRTKLLLLKVYYLQKGGRDTIFSIFSKNSVPRNSKPSAIAFVDYEHWYISMYRMYHQKPDIRQWRSAISELYDVHDILFFGDFSNPSLRAEISKIREISSSIIETQNASSYHKKDYTDFIMLDHIYQRAITYGDNTDVFIIFSGDGHFSSAASFLVNRCGKTVAVYGIRDCFSMQLKNTASITVEWPPLDSISDSESLTAEIALNNGGNRNNLSADVTENKISRSSLENAESKAGGEIKSDSELKANGVLKASGKYEASSGAAANSKSKVNNTPKEGDKSEAGGGTVLNGKSKVNRAPKANGKSEANGNPKAVISYASAGRNKAVDRTADSKSKTGVRMTKPDGTNFSTSVRSEQKETTDGNNGIVSEIADYDNKNSAGSTNGGKVKKRLAAENNDFRSGANAKKTQGKSGKENNSVIIRKKAEIAPRILKADENTQEKKLGLKQENGSEAEPDDIFTSYYKDILTNIRFLERNNIGKMQMKYTFGGTVDSVSEYYGVDRDMVSVALDRLCDRGYIETAGGMLKSSKTFTVNWDKAVKDKLI